MSILPPCWDWGAFWVQTEKFLRMRVQNYEQ